MLFIALLLYYFSSTIIELLSGSDINKSIDILQISAITVVLSIRGFSHKALLRKIVIFMLQK